MSGSCGPHLPWAAGCGSIQTVRNSRESFREGLTVPHTWPHMLQCEVLVRKAASVDGLPSRAIVVGKVTSLQRIPCNWLPHSWQCGSPEKGAQPTQGSPSG